MPDQDSNLFPSVPPLKGQPQPLNPSSSAESTARQTVQFPLLEAERQRRSLRPLHAQEREDAPPQVLRDLWRHLAHIASALGAGAALPASAVEIPYDPVLYQVVYQRLLTQRQVLVLPMDTILPTTTLSVYDFAVPRYEVVPTVAEVTRFIGVVEQQYPDLGVLQQEIDRWYMPS